MYSVHFVCTLYGRKMLAALLDISIFEVADHESSICSLFSVMVELLFSIFLNFSKTLSNLDFQDSRIRIFDNNYHKMIKRSHKTGNKAKFQGLYFKISILRTTQIDREESGNRGPELQLSILNTLLPYNNI